MRNSVKVVSDVAADAWNGMAPSSNTEDKSLTPERFGWYGGPDASGQYL